MNPYAIIGGIVLFLAACAGSFFEGKHVARGEAAVAREEAQQGFQKQLDAADARATKAAEDAAAAKIRLDVANRNRTREVIRYVSTPAAAVTCLDADGMRVWNGDAAAGADSVQPVGPVPGPAEPVHPQ